jgi:hypothetical protein
MEQFLLTNIYPGENFLDLMTQKVVCKSFQTITMLYRG